MMAMLIVKMTILLAMKLVVVTMMTMLMTTMITLLLLLIIMLQIRMTTILNLTDSMTTVTMMVRIMGTSRFSPGFSPVNFSTQTAVINWTGFLIPRSVGAGVGDIGRAVRHALVGCQEVP